MIVAVTGPSAAGKSTWCRQHYRADVIEEHSPTGCVPLATDLASQAAFWCAVNVGRWDQAIRREQVSGLAVCDDDPMKLHYTWSLLQQRRDSDPTRRRGNFALHVRLAEPFRRWYETLGRLDPGRVFWELPLGGLPADLPPVRANRCDLLLFDALIAQLPQEM